MTYGRRSDDETINTKAHTRMKARMSAGRSAYHEFEVTAAVACAPSAIAKSEAAKSARMDSFVKNTLPYFLVATRPSMSTS